MKKTEGQIKIITRNHKATYSYILFDRFEAGISLQGTEVKSIRQGQINLTDAYCKVEESELSLVNLHIAPYAMGGYVNHQPKRKRRLLMHKREIVRLRSKLVERGFTLIPLALYFKRGMVKVELALAKGKKMSDKRESLREKDAQRELRNYRQ